nr:demethylmenaquinone methyltransferase [Actinoplanes sp. N902-109]
MYCPGGTIQGVTRADLDKQPHEVAEMFDGVAQRYDLTNTVLSFGQDRGWRRATRTALALRPGERVLDVGAGTGVSTEELERSGAYAVGADLSTGMLRVGRRSGRQVPLVAGDALKLPFGDETFDAVTISFALRNVADTGAALRELARITRPGGRLVVCEFSTPTNAAFRTLYLSYLMRSLPSVARTVSSNPDAYVYLAESIRAWPDQTALAGRIAESGAWTRVGWRNLTGGIVALHRATKG